MQKKLIALAIAGLASAAAFAQANVTIYGIVDASVDSVGTGNTTAGGAAGTGGRTTKISSNSSRIGFKGTEDLSDGLKAIFQLETAFNADGTATTNLNSRNTFVGLASDSWGQVILGQYDTPYKSSTRYLDVFADHLADNRNLMGGSPLSAITASGAQVGFDSRPANTVRYDSPDLNGFKFAAAYVAGAEASTLSNQTKGDAWSLSGNYTFTSAWNGIVAYEKHDFGTNGTGSTFAAPNAAIVNQSEKAWKLGVGYKEGAIRVGLVYEKTSDDFAVATTKGHKAWTLDGGYTVGSNEFKLAYTKANNIDSTSTVGDTGAKQWAVGVDHILSKRTKLYAEYVKLTNDAKGVYGLTGAGSNNTASVANLGAGANPSALQLGVRHTF